MKKRFYPLFLFLCLAFLFNGCSNSDSSDLPSYDFCIRRMGGHVYYVDDYTIEDDGSITFTIDNTTYHFVEYAITDLR